MKSIVTTSALILSALAMHAETQEDAIASLVAAERGFAQASLDSGVKAAFLGVLAADSTVYQPGPMNGREAYGNAEDPPIVLSWYPAVADIATSGDLGFTTGPYTVASKDPAETRRGAGHYTSVWRRSAEGKWELLVDLGTPHAAAAEPVAPWEPDSGDSPLAPALADDARNTRRDELLARDAALGKPADGEKYITVLQRFAESEAWIYRPGSAPFEGLAAAAANDKIASEVVTSEPSTAAVSAAGDWGYTLGSMSIRTGEDSREAHYLRLWHHPSDGGEWRLFVETFAFMPRPKPAG